jgi:hypothetical protein
MDEWLKPADTLIVLLKCLAVKLYIIVSSKSAGTGESPHAWVIYCLINIAPPNPTLAEGRGGRSSVGKRITFCRINQNGPTSHRLCSADQLVTDQLAVLQHK